MAGMGEQFLDWVLDSWHFVRMYVFPESHRMHLSQRRQVLEQNPYFPFTLEVNTPTNRRFILRRPYKQRRYSLLGGLCAFGLILLMLGYGRVRSTWFLYPCVAFAVCLMVAYAYWDVRVYGLDETNAMYYFRVGTQVVHGPYHNVYIRMGKRHADSFNERPAYYLFFDGCSIDKIVITNMSEQMMEVRKFGQQLADNLRINYFDEQNISMYHHVRPLREPIEEMDH